MVNRMTALQGYLKKKVLLFFALGLSCGIPFNLIGNTLSLWVKESGVDLKTIGLFAFAMIPYSFKFLWAPVIDRVRLPYLSRLGAKKAWGILFQIGLLVCLLMMSWINPQTQIGLLFGCCFMAAFFAASQDIVVDALRIDTLSGDSLKEGSAIYQFGYRMGLLVTGAGVIALSAFVPWQVCYMISSFLILIGLVSLYLIQEPLDQKHESVSFKSLIVNPFVDFIHRHAHWVSLLVFIVLYKLSNALLGKMSYPFYADIGFSKNEIALISGTIGPWITMAGVFLGGLLMVRFGYLKSLLYLGMVEILTSLAYAGLALIGPNAGAFLMVIFFDNVVGGMGGAVFVGFLSALCVRVYSATQYALLTSFMMIATSFFAGFSGHAVHFLGWVNFFIFTGIIMIPALLLLSWLIQKEKIS